MFNLLMPSPQFISTHSKRSASASYGYDAIPSIAAAYGMRRLRAAYTGSILRLRRSSDNAEQDIGYTAAGDLDTAAVATFVGGGSGYIVSWYDQSGNGYTAAQTTAASQPLYVASGQNGKPVGRWDGSNDYLQTTLDGVASPWTAMVVLSASIASSISSGIVGNILVGATIRTAWKMEQWENTGLMGFTRAGVADYTYAGANSPTGWNVLGLRQGASQILYKNGASYGTLAQNVGLGTKHLGANAPNEDFLNGDIAELIICNAALSDANRQAAEAAANQYFAIY